MLNLSEENKALCFSDSVSKPLYIFLYFLQGYDQEGHAYWRYFKTIDDAIVLESMSIDEGILEGDTFELGSFIVPTIKVKWRNDGIRYKNMVAVPVQKIGNEYIAYFDGYISSEEISQDSQTVSAEIVSFIGERLDIDVLETVKGYSGETLYAIIQNALSQTVRIWVYGSETDELLNKFKNANTIINLNAETLPQTLTVNELLKQAGEFLGAHIIVKEKRVVNIDDMINYQPSTMPIIDFIRFSDINTVLQGQIKSLPSGYKRVEYIESTGTQYIDTNILPDDTTKIQIKFAMSEYTGYVIVGYYANESDSFRLFNYNGNTYLDYGSEGNRLIGDDTYDGRINEGKIYDLEVGNRYVKDLVTGREKVNGSAVSFDEKTFSIGIFDGGDVTDKSSSGKVFYCKIYKSNTLVADLVPCIRETDNNVGMYDLVRNEFFANQGTDSFIAPNPIETYTLPYYINSSVDKTNSLSIDKISVSTKTGDQLNYTQWLKDKAYNTYGIKDNIFFEALSAQSWEQCYKAVQEVGVYLDTLNLYYSDLQCIYPLFIEGGDYLIIKSKNQRLLPNEYLVLDNITLSNKNINSGVYIDTEILPNSDDIEIEVDFSLLDGTSNIFIADARNDNADTLSLFANANSLTSLIGYYGGSTQLAAFKIPYVPINQKININIKCGKYNYKYSGTFNGSGTYFGGASIHTGTSTITLGSLSTSGVNFKLYHFAYSQNGVKMCDMYPCMRKSDGVIGVYDIVRNTFKSVQGVAYPEYEPADTVIPILSTTTRGIHSMRTNVLCKAVNSNNK